MKIPLFSITPLIESYYIEQIDSEKINSKEARSIKKSEKILSKSIEDPIKWIFVEFEGQKSLVLMKKSLDNHVFLTGPLRLKKAKIEKDLEYWKRKLLDVLRLQKSLSDILYPEGAPEEAGELLLKARGFPVGTIRNWRGKEHKKMANGKWVRTYRELESRGAKQAIRNVRRKIISASTMEELLEIVKQNASRFQDEKGKMLPIVKEFIAAVRGTEAGKKPIREETVELEPVSEIKNPLPQETTTEDAEDLMDQINEKFSIEGVEFYHTGEDGDISFMAEVAREDVLDNIPVDPYDILSKTESEVKELLSIQDKETRGEDKQQRKERSDKGVERAKNQALENIIEGFGGREKFKQALLQGRKAELEGRGAQIDLATGEAIERQTDVLIGTLIEKTGLTEEEILKELGIGTRAERKKTETITERKKREIKQTKTNIEEYDETLDPTSALYKFRDTGYIAGSRKELAAEYIKLAKKDGRTVKTRAIDWVDLEKNPREAQQLITKSNLFGIVDWEMLKKDGMQPDAGFLIDRVYASISKEPENDPVARRNYSYGIESIRERLEKSKTPEDVTNVLKEIREEFEGTMMSAKETEEYEKLTEELQVIGKEISIKKDEANRIYEISRTTLNEMNQLKYKREARERRGWKPEPELNKKEKELTKKFDIENEAYMAYRKKYPESSSFGLRSDEESEILNEYRRLRNKRSAVLEATKIRNLAENPYTRAWMSLGDRFIGVVNYRNYKGSKSFGNHVAKAKYGQIKTWDWAEKKGGTIKKANKAAVKFQLKVAEKYSRKGGRNVKTGSTHELKDKFNLREVQSGNWVLKDPISAKFHVERSGEAFADLSDITGIPDDKISFNGRLAMAFGARGKGSSGFSGGAPVAHYERIHRVINLTKMGGGGSLAHEWFHSMDNLLSESYGVPEQTGDMLTEAPETIQNEILKNAFGDLVGVMTKGEAVSYANFQYTSEDYKNAVYNFGDRMITGAMGNRKLTGFRKDIVEAGSVEKAVDVIDNYFDPDIEKYELAKDVAGKAGETYRVKSYTSKLRKLNKNKKGWKKIAVAYVDGNKEGGKAKVPTERGLSNFKKEAMKLDGGRKNSYWSTNIEMAARAFAAYIDDKLTEKDRKNDYLSAYADNKYYKDPIWGDTFPYPEGEERKRINESMDNLFKVIKDNNMIQKALDVEF